MEAWEEYTKSNHIRAEELGIIISFVLFLETMLEF